MMHTVYNDPNLAMQVAYGIARQTGRRVWRHTVESRYGAARWIVSFIECPQRALQELTA